MFGVVPEGFIIKSQEEIYNSILIGWQGVYGPSFTVPEGSKEDQIINLFSDALSEVWEVALDTYHSIDASQAVGVRLDQIGQWNGAGTRDPGDGDDVYRPIVLAAEDKSSNLTEDVIGKVSNLDGTGRVYLLINDSDVTDVNGLPSHSYTVVVEGGDDNEIADTIWSTQPTGIAPVGNTILEVLDAYGFCRKTGFTRPTFPEILVEIDVKTFKTRDNCGTPSETEIKAAMATYLTDNSIGQGEEIRISQINTAAGSIQGVEVIPNTTKLAIDPGVPVAANLALTYEQISVWLKENITVNIIP